MLKKLVISVLFLAALCYSGETIVDSLRIKKCQSATDSDSLLVLSGGKVKKVTKANMRTMLGTSTTDSARAAGTSDTALKYDNRYLGLHGTADSATGAVRAAKLTTARTIGGTSFDGSANIIPDTATKAHQLTGGYAIADSLLVHGSWFDRNGKLSIKSGGYNPLFSGYLNFDMVGGLLLRDTNTYNWVGTWFKPTVGGLVLQSYAVGSPNTTENDLTITNGTNNFYINNGSCVGRTATLGYRTYMDSTPTILKLKSYITNDYGVRGPALTFSTAGDGQTYSGGEDFAQIVGGTNGDVSAPPGESAGLRGALYFRILKYPNGLTDALVINRDLSSTFSGTVNATTVDCDSFNCSGTVGQKNGYLGIGTTSPSGILQLGAGTFVGSGNYSDFHAGAFGVMFRNDFDCYINLNTAYNGSTYVNKYSGKKPSQLAFLDGNFSFLSGSGTTAGGNSNLVDLMYLSNVGYLGIGTTTPTNKLHVNGAVHLHGGRTDTKATGSPIADVEMLINGYDGYWALRQGTGDDINVDVYNGGTPITAMTILQNGKMGIKCTPTIDLSVNEITGCTSEGGVAQKFYNNTGSTLTRGYIVEIAGTGTKYVQLATAGSDVPLGVVFADIPTGSWGWIVTHGFAYVQFISSVTQTGYGNGYYVAMSAGTAGMADQFAITTLTRHNGEVGHSCESVTNSGLKLCSLHFN